MLRVPVVRKAIKLRKPIHKEFCTCHDIQVLSMNGVPYVWNADKLSFDELHLILSGLDTLTPVMFSEPVEYCRDKIELCLEYKIPVNVCTNKVIPSDLVTEISKVPRSSIQVSMEFLDPFIRNRLAPEASDPSALIEMMHMAKSKKIFQTLEIPWYPHLVGKLDVFEMVEMMKNYVGHVIVMFLPIHDLLYKSEVTKWEALSPKSLESFKHFYEPSVPDRTWRIRNKYQQEFLSDLSDFIKVKRLTIEVVEWDESPRVRHQSVGSADHPLGMRPVLYKKGEEDGKFYLTDTETERPCHHCGKTLFL